MNWSHRPTEHGNKQELQISWSRNEDGEGEIKLESKTCWRHEQTGPIYELNLRQTGDRNKLPEAAKEVKRKLERAFPEQETQTSWSHEGTGAANSPQHRWAG